MAKAKAKEFDNTNRGTLFLQEDKATLKHPDFNGYININGVEHWLAGWKQVSKDGGTKFISLSLGDVRGKQGEKTDTKKSDVPF